MYERFSEVEDAPGKIFKALAPKLRGKAVLDVGCGAGKYAKLFSPHVKSYHGIDISKHQLSIARKRISKLGNVTLVCTDAAETILPRNSFDAAISSWAISPIAGFPRMKRTLAQTFRALKSDGTFYLVENDATGMFEKIRGPHRREETTEYNRWVAKQGFKILKRIKTYFEFSSKAEAKKIFNTIWGDEVSDKIRGKRIAHHVIIFYKRKA